MKREILFRGKAVSNGEWIEGQRHTYGDGVYICQTELMSNGGKDFRVPGIEVDPESVSPIFDTHKLKIAFGDIVLVKGRKRVGEYITQIVEHSNGGFALLSNKTYFNDDAVLVAIKSVLGNIFDNPELFKKSSHHLQM